MWGKFFSMAFILETSCVDTMGPDKLRDSTHLGGGLKTLVALLFLN